MNNKTNLIINRLDIIRKYAADKIVLDVGSSGTPYHARRTTPFDVIAKVAKDYDGVDLQSNHHKIIKGNAEKIKLNKKYDLIVAGDIIEHVTNQGLFLENMKRHLKPNGQIIITTANIRSRYVFLSGHPEHTLWHGYETLLEIGRRANLEPIYFTYYFGNKRLPFIFEVFRHIFYRLFPKHAEGLLVIFQQK